MSKSRGNVVSPQAIIDRYGADTPHGVTSCSLVRPTRTRYWSDKGVEGVL